MKQVKESERLDNMSYLVYWYGEENEANMYSLLAQTRFTPYATGISGTGKKKMQVVPASVQKKVDAGKALNQGDLSKIRAMKAVEEDLAKDQADRRRGILSFVEGYETLKLEDVDEAMVNPNYDETDDGSGAGTV